MVGRPDDFMVFHQSFVTKELVNVVASLELCFWICYSFCIIFYATLFDSLTVSIVISSQKSNTLTTVKSPATLANKIIKWQQCLLCSEHRPTQTGIV